MHRSVRSLVSITQFSLNDGAFLKFLENPETQDGGSKTAAIWQLRRNSFHMTSSLPVPDFHPPCRNFYNCEVIDRWVGGGGGEFFESGRRIICRRLKKINKKKKTA